MSGERADPHGLVLVIESFISLRGLHLIVSSAVQEHRIAIRSVSSDTTIPHRLVLSRASRPQGLHAQRLRLQSHNRIIATPNHGVFRYHHSDLLFSGVPESEAIQACAHEWMFVLSLICRRQWIVLDCCTLHACVLLRALKTGYDLYASGACRGEVTGIGCHTSMAFS